MKFQNILVVEDQEVANLSLRRTLEDLQCPYPQHAHYCDHALTMIKAALKNKQPYDLLVTARNGGMEHDFESPVINYSLGFAAGKSTTGDKNGSISFGLGVGGYQK